MINKFILITLIGLLLNVIQLHKQVNELKDILDSNNIVLVECGR